MIKFFKSLLLFLVFTLPALADSLTINLNEFTANDGLSDNQTNCVIQDKYGFIWIGTKDGLNRFDGKSFQVFKFQSDKNSVSGNNITCLEVTDDSLLWIGTASNGFCSYNYKTNTFQNYHARNSPLRAEYINDLAFDKVRNCIWVAMNNGGLQQFDLKNKKLNPYVYSINSYYAVAVKDTISLFAGIIESLKKLDNVGRNKGMVGDTATTINTIYIDNDLNVWCGAWDNALHLFNIHGKRLQSYIFDGTSKFKKSGEEIISISSDASNNIWCGTKSSGIFIFNKASKSFINNINFSHQINTRVNELFRDSQNRIWIATENGLLVYDQHRNQFRTEMLPVPKGVNACKVFDRLITDKGLDLVITQCGLFYKKSPNESYKFKTVIYRNEEQELYSILMTKNGDIYIGSNRTVFKFNPENISFNTIDFNKNLKETSFYFNGASLVNSLTSFKQDNSELIAASYYGNYIVLIDFDNRNLYYLIHENTKISDNLENLSRKIWVDSKNNFWVCGRSKGLVQLKFKSDFSLSKYAADNDSMLPITVMPTNWNMLPNSIPIKIKNVFDIAERKDGTYWLSTQGAGLVLFSKENKTSPFKIIDSDITSMQGIKSTGDSLLWIITSSGLLQYNEKTNFFKLYDASSGLSQNIFGYFFQNKPGDNNTLSVGFNGGFISYNPSQLLSSTEKPNLQFTKLWVMDKPSDSLLFSDIKLHHNQNFLKVYVSPNIYTNSDKITYFYRLSGIDDNWRSNDNNPIITYTNLPPGKFRLDVKAISNNNLQSDIKTLSFVIVPPFTSTIWFYGIVVFSIGAFVYFIYRYRINQLLRLQEVRNNIARDLHDDIGSTLGSIHLYSQIADNKMKQDKHHEIPGILEKIKKSSKEIIEKTGDTVWVVKASNDNMSNLSLRMETYAASILGDADINFNFIVEENIQNLKINMAQRKNLFLIFKEAIHNIVKYSHCTQVDIHLSRNRGMTFLKIKDNGCGIDMANNHSQTNGNGGNGLKNMASRAKDLNAEFQINSAPGKGTEITISLKQHAI
ncbi:MAG TPA: two-component regulator propeller domain-containing protein [Bacteroidia bacterium]|nr:hypothetical protein [Bacteroidia bacterium]MBP7714722.1 hypothetical protein [Bacteroidia bacterium]MBP8668219.1 hypothetical protein [Bacteroidia bacterium]HOZ89996.1 two-component regulator propeller domain-containing protein [Bacteroidia bacterium]HQW16618.1 two-component regulator propeller domain-containing protein [Bacteroidia bacterium]